MHRVVPAAPAPWMLTRGRGLAELVLSSLVFGVMAFTAKRATRSLDGAQVAFIRFAVGLAGTAVYLAARRRPPRVVRKDLLFLRGAFGGTAVLLYFLAIARLPVGTATLLNYTAPVFTAIFASLFLREHLPAGHYGAMVVAGVGVYLVVHGQGDVLGGEVTWQLIALGSAVLSGAAVTAIRAARRTDGPWEVFGAFCLVGMVCTAPNALASWRSPDAHSWGLLMAVGLLSLVAQMLMTHALGVVKAATSGVIAQLTVVTALGLGHFLNGDPISLVSAVGSLLTLVGVSAATYMVGRT
jgi:drug/metabolite transporter (DMT)-like permease